MKLKKKNKLMIGSIIVGLVAIASVVTIMLLQSQSTSGNLDLVGQIDTNGETMNVQIRDNIAYVIDTEDDNPGGLILIDISNPESPVLLGSYYNGGMPFDFVLIEDLAFVANRFDGLEILNISVPSEIVRSLSSRI